MVRFIANERKFVEKAWQEIHGHTCISKLHDIHKKLWNKYATGSTQNNKTIEESVGHSWYSSETNHCTQWHIDAYSYSMLILAYPNPTEILVGQGDTSKVDMCAGQNNNIIVDELLKSGCSILTPNIGDIYYIPPNVPHRTSPKDHNKPHLVLRLWNPILKPKYEQ